MEFQLEELILWPRNDNFEPRKVIFKPGHLNLITGASKTGKSAIIPIIDYCLCSSKCAIPTGVIRDSVAWYGVVVNTGVGKLMIARKDPDDKASSQHMYLLEGDDIDIPIRIPDKNDNLKNIKELLNQLSGITNVDFDVYKTGRIEKKRPSFRDMAAFNYQSQNIVANPNVLFFKADAAEHREKLKTIFEYVLGAVTPEVLAMQHRLEDLHAEYRRKNREVEALRKVSDRWVGQIRGFALRAQELGLLDIDLENMPPDGILESLKNISNSDIEARPTNQGIGKAASRIADISEEQAATSNNVMRLKSRLSDMEAAKRAIETHKGVVYVKKDRLSLSRWLEGKYTEENKYFKDQSMLRELVVSPLINAFNELEENEKTPLLVEGSFEREFLQLKNDLDKELEKLRGLRTEKNEINVSSDSEKGFDDASAQMFLGELNYALKNLSEISGDSDLLDELVILDEEIKTLQDQLRGANIKGKKASALKKVNNYSSQWLPQFDIERPDDPIELIDSELTIKVVGDGRSDYLWEIGSGANWVSYHVATSLGLQQYFTSQDISPVPNYLIYDQPSQVYFPRKISNKKEEDPKLDDDEDISAVKAIFKVCNDAIEKVNGTMQIIVLDHAPKEFVQDLEFGYVVEEWRDGEKLVPEVWLT